MKSKRAVGSTVSMMLIFGALLSACGGNGSSGTSTGTGAATTPGTGGSNSTSAPAASNFDKKMTITMYNAGGFSPNNQPPSNREDDPLRQMLEKAVNIDLQMTVPPADQIKPKLNTMVASGDIPDLIFMTDRLTAVQYYDQGIVADLDSVMKDYPELYNRFDKEAWSAMQYKGKTIGMPGYELVNGINGWWIRNDWLKKLNLQVPTTPEELLNVMKAFTEKDPDGNGKNDTYGFATGILKDGNFSYPGNSGFGWDAIMMMFGVVPNMVDSIDGKITFDNTDPRMKEALAYMNQMVAANVVDPDWVTTNDVTALEKKMLTGKYGIVYRDWRSMELSSQQKMKDVAGEVPEWTVIPPMKGPHGDQWVSFSQFQSNSWTVSKKAAKDPEKLKRVMSLLQYWYADKEALPYFSYGQKGIMWDMVDGKPARLKENMANKDLVQKWQWQGNYFLPRRSNDALYFNFTNDKTDGYNKLNLKYIKPNKVNPYVLVDANDTLYNDRIKYVNETLLKFIVGREPISNWDNYVNTLDTKFNYKKYKEDVLKQLNDAGVKP
ncbi:extracellular solute-binding protein [Paenibacillus radicis (ex Xue et al. 2023)]|uniref:Extracellular solute-binding protein n=1 Tax=Paenibacillus radicis (ex Xue et al. 2023) TaxID=2972489 RepID=A0ABT1YHK3_9BACL|nr:extracellular solute-binding protein [Paenibacillus radicis (ex Xue et al. 2023)]MCR8632680.1 extracellular solute-binding protein [Paenibacillus radicis (ex Xue et al. 2023)]